MKLKVRTYSVPNDLGFAPALGPYEVEADGVVVGVVGVLGRHDGAEWRWAKSQWPKGDPRRPAVGIAILNYLAEKAKRSVVVSATTMRPMSEAPFDGTRVLLLDGTEGIVTAWFDATWTASDQGGLKDELLDPRGWWPLPDLTPMPAEFEGWDA